MWERERGRESRSFKSLCITVIFLEVFPCGVVYTVKINVLHKVLKFRMIILNKKKKNRFLFNPVTLKEKAV